MAGIFIMSLYVSSGLNVPTKNLRFSLPVCLFSVNIPVCRIDFKYAANVLGHFQSSWTGLGVQSERLKWATSLEKCWSQAEDGACIRIPLSFLLNCNHITLYVPNIRIIDPYPVMKYEVFKDHILYFLI